MKGVTPLRIVIAWRRTRSRLSRFVTGSLAVHGVLVAAILVVPATRRHVTPIEDTMVAALAGPLEAAPAALPAVAAAAPAAKPAAAPPPAPKEAHAVREIPPPKPKDKPVKPKKEPEKGPDTPARGSAKGSTGSSPAPAAPPAAAPAPGSGAVTATVGGGDSSLGWYGAAVKAALEAAWIKPYLEDAQGVASVVVTFDIARDGATRNIRVQTSSGIPSLDRSAERAVIEASPLPAVPPTWTEETLPVTMRFDLAPEPR
jgi:protein TonB